MNLLKLKSKLILLFFLKLSSNHQLHLKNPKGQHHKSRAEILPSLKEKYNVK